MDFYDYIQSERTRDNFFALTKFYININFKLSEICNKDTEAIEKLSILLHEYTHYLQGFCTTLGAVTLFKYFSLQHKIIHETTKKILSGQNYDVTLFSNYINEYDQINSIYNYDIPKENVTNEHYSIFAERIKHPVIKGYNIEYFIKLDTSTCQHISPKCLRESMAMRTYFNLKRLNREDGKQYLESKEYQPHYKYLYLFLYHKYPQIIDLPKFTYFFAELCLQSEKPAIIFNKLIVYLNINIGSYTKAENFFDAFMSSNLEIRRDINLVINKLNKELIKIQKIANNMEYYSAIFYYMQLCINGLKHILSNATIYKGLMDAKYIEYFINRFSSPIIVQSVQVEGRIEKKIKTIDGNSNTIDLALLFSISNVLDKYISSKEEFTKCPYIEEFPICSLINERDLEICLRDPYSIKTFDNGGCIFYNANLVFGFLQQSEIEKHIG